MNIMLFQPTRGLTEDEIMDNRQYVLEKIREDGDLVLPDVELPAERFKHARLTRLVLSLELLAQRADGAYFLQGWQDATHCRVAHLVCELYDIPVSYFGTI